jgi:aminopeptidase N/puromycin-sensitive aminopeptidase
MLSEVLGPMLEEIGVEPAAGEDPLLSSYRIDLLVTLGRQARAPYVLATAQAVLAAFLETPEQVPAGRLRWALSLAAEDGDALLWERLQKIALETNNPSVRGSALSALGAFRAPALQDRSLAFILDPRVRSNELWSLYGPSMRDPALYARSWAWFKANHAAVVGKIGEEASAGLPRAGGGFCDAAGQADVRAFFEALPKQPEGIARNLSQTLERIGACDVQVNATLDDLRELLGDKKP